MTCKRHHFVRLINGRCQACDETALASNNPKRDRNREETLQRNASIAFATYDGPMPESPHRLKFEQNKK